MGLIKYFLAVVFTAAMLPLAAQTITYDDLNFEDDSTTTTYKPVSKHYAFIRSKRGTDGMNKTPAVDSVLAKTINEIVLVFTETNADAMAEREDANEERWRNLLETYPELFQFSTTYKSVCQCNWKGDAEAFKRSQGFYIYYAAPEPKTEEKKVAVETKKEEKKSEEKKVEEKRNNKKEKEEKSEEKKEVAKKEDKKEKNKEEKNEKSKEKDTEAEVAATPAKEETVTLSDADFAKKKTGYNKPKRAKDAKACRPPCYENGDEDLNNFFKDNITLSKKQKRHGKSLVSMVRIQLNFDGSVKKAMVTGADEVLNQQVTAAIKMMNLWNPAVKGGLTVKSDVKITLKYDKETHAMKPFEIMINPRPGPKCKCASDAELGIN